MEFLAYSIATFIPVISLIIIMWYANGLGEMVKNCPEIKLGVIEIAGNASSGTLTNLAKFANELGYSDFDAFQKAQKFSALLQIAE